MAKVDLEVIKMVLERNEVEASQAAQILADIHHVLDEEEAAKELKPPPVKKQFVILVADPKGLLERKDLTGWVLQVPEEDSPYVAEERLVRGAYEFNTSPRGRRLPVKTVGEACEVVPAKTFKEEKIWVKTKEPVLVVTTDNVIPKAEDSGAAGEP